MGLPFAHDTRYESATPLKLELGCGSQRIRENLLTEDLNSRQKNRCHLEARCTVSVVPSKSCIVFPEKRSSFVPHFTAAGHIGTFSFWSHWTLHRGKKHFDIRLFYRKLK